MGLRRNRFMVDKTSHHGLIAFTNVKTQMAQDGFMKKHIHVGLTSHLEWHLQTADCKSVRNIPKFKDRANWSRDTFQPMRRRACVYQNTNQKLSQQWTESDRISHRFEALRHIFKTFHEGYTIFLSGQRIGSHIGSVYWNIQQILRLIYSFKQRDV